MPKRVMPNLLRDMRRHIKGQFKTGDRYLTVRAIAKQFGVSLQTADKAVKTLVADGMLSAARKRGITVTSPTPCVRLAGRRIAVVSRVHDFRFNEAFCAGVRAAVAGEDVSVILFGEEVPEDTRSLKFGEYLVALRVEGIVALGFRDSALGFYHAMREGVDLVADIALDELPGLPVVQTDNFAHSREAALLMAKAGHTDVLVAGYYPAGNRRHEGFLAGAEAGRMAGRYVSLAQPAANAELDKFLHSWSGEKGVFSQDYAANYVVASKFLQHRVPVRGDNFVVYDSEDELFRHEGLDPVRAVGPSLKTIGRRLAEKLLARWTTGRYPEPLFEKI